MVDEAKLHQFIGQMLGDLGGAASISMVRIGDALGLYRALHAKGSMTCGELAREGGRRQRALSARVAVASGCIELSRLRAGQREVHPAAGAGNGLRR
jgi:hypothetical protein